MEINLFWKKITIGNAKQDIKENFITNITNRWYQYIGQDITSCGKFVIDLNTMYKVHQENKMAFAYTQKISQMVAGKGFTVVDFEDKEIDTPEAKKHLQTLHSYIGYRHELRELIRAFFDQIFASWQAIAVPSTINGLGLMASTNDWVKVLDTRGIIMETDKYDNVVKYTYQSKYGAETLMPSQVIDYIAYVDINCKYRWTSLYTSIVMDAITNNEASRTQMYFFRNNAQPNLFIMLNPEAFKGIDWPDKKTQFDLEREKKYGGSSNSWKPHSSHLVTDIKTLDISNVDLDLINLRKENDMSLATVFMLDPRLIGLQKEAGSYGEVEVTTITQGNEQIEAYGDMFSDFVTAFYKKFIDPTFAYYIKAVNHKFKNVYKDKEIGIKEREKGLISPNEYRKKFEMDEVDSDGMDKYTVIASKLIWADDEIIEES